MINKRFIIAMLLIITLGLLIFYIYNFRPDKEDFVGTPLPAPFQITPEIKVVSILANEFKVSDPQDTVHTALKGISVHQQYISDAEKTQLGLTYPIIMYRFSPYGSILDIKGIPGPDFTLYFLVQFDTENKPQQETIVYHPNFNITKDENGVVMLNYKQKDKDL